MFTRSEMYNAILVTGLSKDKIFCKFVTNVTRLYPNSLYSAEARARIIDLIYASKESDIILSALLILYNELTQNRKPTEFGLVYDSFYNTNLLDEIKTICLHSRPKRSSFDDDPCEENVLIELISLLNIYYYPGGLDERPNV